MIQFFFSPTVSIQLENTTVYVDFCSWLNITTRPQSSFFSLPPTTWYFQRQPWIWKIFKIPHLKHAEQKSHPCYQWGHLNVCYRGAVLCCQPYTQSETWNQPNPGEEPKEQRGSATPEVRNANEAKKKRKEKGVDLLLRTKRELTRTRLKTVHIMEIQEMHH